MSRRPPPAEMMALLPVEARSRVEHIASDFMVDPKDIAQVIKDKGVGEVDVVFFYSYLQPKPEEGATAWSNAEALVRANSTSGLALPCLSSTLVTFLLEKETWPIFRNL